MGESRRVLRVGAAQVAEVLLDREATLEKDVEYIRKAGEEGLDLVVFPEYHIPGGPHWYYMGDVDLGGGDLGFQEYYKALFDNAMTVPGPTTDRLCEAAREAGTAVVMGGIEKVAGTAGTMYNSQVFIDADGTLLGVRRKIVPTMTGRVFFTGGTGTDVRTFDSSIGTLSGLMCGEHTNPLLVYSVLAEGAEIHAASWPALPWREPCEPWCGIRSRYLAFAGKVPVVATTGIVTDELAATVGRPDWAGLAGASSIISPSGEYLAEPKTDGEEGLIYADVDMGERTLEKATHDILGHYNRFDIFDLTVDRRSHPRLTVLDEGDDGAAEHPDQVRVTGQSGDGGSRHETLERALQEFLVSEAASEDEPF